MQDQNPGFLTPEGHFPLVLQLCLLLAYQTGCLGIPQIFPVLKPGIPSSGEAGERSAD